MVEKKNLLSKLLSEALDWKIEQKADVMAMLETYGIAVGDVIRA